MNNEKYLDSLLGSMLADDPIGTTFVPAPTPQGGAPVSL